MDRVLLVKRMVHVFITPQLHFGGRYRASQWPLDKPDRLCRLRVMALPDNSCSLWLEDSDSGELFAKCPIDKFPSSMFEPVTDSSRYFVLTLVSDDGMKRAQVGIGFEDRGDAFDLNVSLQDHFKTNAREMMSNATTTDDEGSKSAAEVCEAMKLEEGQTIRLNFGAKPAASSSSAAADVDRHISKIISPSIAGDIPKIPPPPPRR